MIPVIADACGLNVSKHDRLGSYVVRSYLVFDTIAPWPIISKQTGDVGQDDTCPVRYP